MTGLLDDSLAVAVPMWVERVRHLPFDVQAERAQVCMQAVAEHGDRILYRSKGTAVAFNRLVEGLALQPGGVSAFGHRWEAAP